MNFVIAIVLIAASYLLTVLLTPKPQRQKPASLEDVEVNTAEDGREVGVLFGTRDVQPNWVWYGDLKAKPVKKKGGKK